MMKTAPRRKRTKTFARQLRDRREQLNVSQAALADEVGVSDSAVWLWEAGQTRPCPKTLKRVLRALGLEAIVAE